MGNDATQAHGYGGGRSWKEREFICRVCGCKEYFPFQVTGFNGRRHETEILQCRRCSVLFANWRDFTAAP